MLSAQSVQIHGWNYKEGNDSYLLGALRGHRAEHSTAVLQGLEPAAAITSMEGRSGFGSMEVGRRKSGFTMHGVTSVPC